MKPEDRQVPEPGQPAPDFELPGVPAGVRLSQVFGARKVVLTFYTEDNTPLCSAQVGMLQEDYEIIQGLGAEVVAVSADSLKSHREFAERAGGFPFPLLSDTGLEAARLYGVADESGKRCRRAMFVIDRGGTVLHAEPWFQPGNPDQYEAVFRALGFEA